jgi:stage III sporulation protein AA
MEVTMRQKIQNEIIKYFPEKIKNEINKLNIENFEEIRFRVLKPIIIKEHDKETILNIDGQAYILSKEELNKTFEMICSNSIYAFQEELANGFITIAGGHRIGITGKPLYKEGKIYSMKDISSLNIRIARQVLGCADNIIEKIIDKNVLIVALPGAGKTTLLRDIVRQISNSGKNIGIVDERSEIAAVYKGIPQNDIGIRSDVIDSVYKADGIKMLVRSMKPDYIATDEIGNDDDIEAIKYAINAGVKIIATAHGGNIEDLKRRKKLYELIENKIFEKIIFINKDRKINVVG